MTLTVPSSQWFTHYCFTVIGYIFEVCIHTTILHVRNEKGTGADICPTIVSGIVTGDPPVSYWPIFFPCPYQQSQKSLRDLTQPRFLLVSKVANFGSCLKARSRVKLFRSFRLPETNEFLDENDKDYWISNIRSSLQTNTSTNSLIKVTLLIISCSILVTFLSAKTIETNLRINSCMFFILMLIVKHVLQTSCSGLRNFNEGYRITCSRLCANYQIHFLN